MKSGYLKWCDRVPLLTTTRLRQSNIIKQGRIAKIKFRQKELFYGGTELSGLGTKIKGTNQQDK
jgi:hypothetical protein